MPADALVSAAPARPAPPVAAEKPTTRTVHGVTLSDPYAWLRDPAYPAVTDPEILAHLDAENAYTAAWMQPHAGLTESLYREMRGRIREDDSSVPYRRGDWLYYSRFETGSDYPLVCRKPANGRRGSPADIGGPDETVVIDQPALADGHGYFRLGAVAIAPDETTIAYATDTDGSERYTLHVKRLDTGAVPDETIPGTSGAAVWAEDGLHLFYTVLDPRQRPNQVFRHRIGTRPDQDVLVYEESDPGFFLGISKTLSRRWLLIHGRDKTADEIRLIDARAPTTAAVLVHPRTDGLEYDLEHFVGDPDDPRGGWFFVRTNDTGRNFRLCRVRADTPQKPHWEEVIGHDPARYLTDVDVFARWLVTEERRDGLAHLQVRPLGADAGPGAMHEIPFPDPAWSVGTGSNAEYDTDVLRFGYTSLVRPPSTFDYDMADRRLTLLKEQDIPSGYDRNRYVSERLTATAPDGTAVPVSIVQARDRPRDGSGPVYLYGYGSYGHGIDPYFSANRISLLDRGVAFALAHVRGGDELGYHWYEAGKLANKPNSFTDAVAVAEHLVTSGHAGRGRVAIAGGSAGGMLVGATLNIAGAQGKGDLFGAAVADVPFVDVLNTMLDDSLPLTPLEYKEWGNPADPDVFHRLRGYCPYSNVAARAYPPMFVTAGISDPRVTYWEPAKWVAKLRATKTDTNPILLRTNMAAGHGGASGRWSALREQAEAFAFVLVVLGAVAAGADG